MSAGVSPDAVLASAVALGTFGVGGLVALVIRLGRQDAQAEAFKDLVTKVDAIQATVLKELNHNGGSSMKDMARDAARDAGAALEKAGAVEEKLLIHATESAAHRSSASERQGQLIEAMRKLQHDSTAMRTGLYLHVHQAQQAQQLLAAAGLPSVVFTTPDGSPLPDAAAIL